MPTVLLSEITGELHNLGKFFRCSLIGRDANRTYNVYGPDRIPEVHHTMKLVQYCKDTYKVSLIDISDE